jgi:uncharacterized protein YrrD
MEDLGAPSSFVVLEPGTPVFASDGDEVGRVSEVRADEGTDIFDGLMIEQGLLPGQTRFVAADLIDEIFERGVVLSLDSKAAETLPDEA